MKNLIADNLNYAGITLSDNAKSSLKWTEHCGRLIKIKSIESIPVPDPAYENFTVGLGWDTGAEGIDIDASVLTFDK